MYPAVINEFLIQYSDFAKSRFDVLHEWKWDILTFFSDYSFTIVEIST